jgi:predicted O-linked N-acetylglucosamine transferase (SPINDLY family)
MSVPPQPAPVDEFPIALRFFQAGDLARAEEICRHLITHNPRHDRALYLLGLIAHRVGQHQPAADLMKRAVLLNPGMAGYHAHLATVLTALGQHDDAIAAATRALQLHPNFPDALINLGNALLAKGQADQAIEYYRRTIAVSPSAAAAPPDAPSTATLAQNNLARVLHVRGRMDEATALLQDITRRHPRVAGFRVNLGNAFKDQGRIDQAIAEYRAAVDAEPDNPTIASSLLYALWFSPSLSPVEILHEHLRWSRRHADPLRDPRKLDNDHDPNRRLRIGYISPDFRNHVSGYLIEPVLAHHDYERFEIFCYSNVITPDDFTEKLKQYADTWRSTTALSDQALADQIRADRIDILIDVTCHMANNRALVLARKPAPIQVNYLAYPATSGMSAMDYRITCPLLDPEISATDDATTNTERLVRIPNTFWCYGPSLTAPPVNELPALTTGTFTFASLNAYSKVNEQVVELWSQVLRAVPNSRLMILILGGLEGNRAAAARFEAHNVPATRLHFVDYRPRDEYLALFHQADLCLDPFPYNGHTTSLDSLYMGVPFVTLQGATPISRAGACMLTHVHLTDFIAPTQERYVQLCAELASNLPHLAKLRRELRHRMTSSPLTDAPTFTRNLESAYRQMWHNYTATH